MGSGWHLIRYFYEKKQIIILLLCWVYALPTQPTLGQYCSLAAIDWPGSKVEQGIYIQERARVTMIQHLGSCSVGPGTRGIIINGQCQFLCGTEANLPPPLLRGRGVIVKQN